MGRGGGTTRRSALLGGIAALAPAAAAHAQDEPLSEWAEWQRAYPRSTVLHQQKRLEDIGRRIAAAAGDAGEWEFVLFEGTRVIYAFALPERKVGCFDGVLVLAGNDDGQLAYVLGHEIAHVVKRHAQSQAVHDAGVRGRRMTPTFLGAANWRMRGRNIDDWIPDWNKLSYSRDLENEADLLGLDYAHAAGFDVTHAPDFWRRILARERALPADQRQFSGQDTPEARAFASHPLTMDRVRTMQDHIRTRGYARQP